MVVSGAEVWSTANDFRYPREHLSSMWTKSSIELVNLPLQVKIFAVGLDEPLVQRLVQVLVDRIDQNEQDALASLVAIVDALHLGHAAHLALVAAFRKLATEYFLRLSAFAFHFRFKPLPARRRLAKQLI